MITKSRDFYSGHEKAAKLLIDSGSNINEKNNYKNSPLRWAVWTGRENIVKLLIESGVDVNSQNYDGSTPLHEASIQGSFKLNISI